MAEQFSPSPEKTTEKRALGFEVRTPGEVALTAAAREALEAASRLPEVSGHLAELYNEDPATYRHSMDVTHLFMALAGEEREAGHLSQRALDAAAVAGLLHDMGKLDNPVIMDQPNDGSAEREVKLHLAERKLTDEERALLTAHARYSHDRIKGSVDDPLVHALVALHHQLQPQPGTPPEKVAGVLEELGLSDQDRNDWAHLSQMLEAADKAAGLIDTERVYRARPKMPTEVERILHEEFASQGGDQRYVDGVLGLLYPNGAEVAERAQATTFADSQHDLV